MFDSVSIESLLSCSGQKITVSFTDSFAKEDFNESAIAAITENETTIQFRNLKKNYARDFTVSEIREHLYNHILPLLYLNSDKEVTIILRDNYYQKNTSIKTRDLPKLEQQEFFVQELETNIQESIAFTLYYSFEATQKSDSVLNDLYCANKRTVCKFKKKDLEIKTLEGYKTTFLLTSPFFDQTVNDERDDFDIFPKITNLTSLLSWEKINEKLKDNLKKILYSKYPDLEENNRSVIKSIKEDNLHLAEYLQDIDSLGGLIDYEAIIRKAEDQYSQDKTSFRKELQNREMDSAEIIRKASYLAGKELIEYVVTRDKIISQLDTFDKNDEKLEKSIHDLILRKGSDFIDISPISLKENNIWLIDDKFMSYCYVASDKTIKTVLRKTGNLSDSSLRPDISIFFDNKQGSQNAVIIELKSFGVDPQKKFSGLLELREYSREFRTQKNIDSIWYYLITKTDAVFERLLLDDGFRQLFSTGEKLYFKFYEALSLYLFVMSCETLIADAKARNKTFIDIIRGINGLNG